MRQNVESHADHQGVASCPSAVFSEPESLALAAVEQLCSRMIVACPWSIVEARRDESGARWPHCCFR
jgi:hypothetical protein